MTLTLRPYQEKSVDFLTAKPRRLLLLEQGLGKTPVAIETCNRVEDIDRVLIVCPAIAREMWRRRVQSWRRRDWKAAAVSYDYFSNNGDVHAKFDTLILDEGHYLRGVASTRTRNIYGRGGIAERAKRVWVLSGTLTPNGPHEVYTHLRGLFPEALVVGGLRQTYEMFLDRYFKTRIDDWGQIRVVAPKPERVEELRALVSPHTLRMLAKEVWKECPPLEIDHVTLGWQAPEEFTLIEPVTGDEDLPEELPFSTESKEAGLALAPFAAEYVINELRGGIDKIVVFFYHRDAGATLREQLSPFGCVYVAGDTNDKQRQDAIDSFQTDPASRVFLGQVEACSTAIDLFAAARTVFAEASWVPEVNAQAIKRMHRIGQQRPCHATFLSLAGSIHDLRTRVLARKTRNIAMLWPTKGESDDSRDR
jgi:SNF2 family DNA or RNA helicase